MATKKKKTKTTKPSTKPKKKVVKKKTTSKKKVAKPIPNPHVGKRYFMIEFGGRGGEFIAGRASEEFVQYWMSEGRTSDELANHLLACNEMAFNGMTPEDLEDLDEEDNDYADFDKNSPSVNGGDIAIEYWYHDDLEHEHCVSAEMDYSGYTVQEIIVNPMAVYQSGTIEWDRKHSGKKNFDWSQNPFTIKEGTSKDITNIKTVYSRELFVHEGKEGIVDPEPVLMMFDSQKGDFGRLYIQTNGEDFDHNKLAMGVCENNMLNAAVEYFYDKESLSIDTGYMSTWGKGFFAYVGYAHKCDIEYDRNQLIEQGWKDLEELE